MMPHWFITFASAAALAVPVYAPGDEESPPTPGTLDLIEGVEERSGRLTIPVTIDGQGPFNFMVDTGSQSTIVSRQLGEQLNLEPAGSATLVGVASSEEVNLVSINAFSFGEQDLGSLVAPVLERRDVGADGIIGADSLQDMRVLLDFRNNALVVGESPDGARSSDYEIVVRARRRLGRLIITNAKLDGIRTAVIIDTGSQGSIGNEALLRRISARQSSGEDVTAEDVMGSFITGEQRMARLLRIGKMNLASLPVTYANAPAFETLGLADRPALILGIEDLRSLDRVAIDFRTSRVMFDVPAAYHSFRPYQRKFFASRIQPGDDGERESE